MGDLSLLHQLTIDSVIYLQPYCFETNSRHHIFSFVNILMFTKIWEGENIIFKNSHLFVYTKNILNLEHAFTKKLKYSPKSKNHILMNSVNTD